MKKKLAKIIRVISIPPVMVTGMILILSCVRDDIFRNTAEVWLSVMFLAIFPVLAYPISMLIPSLREKGREGQRGLAFAFTAAGYLAGGLYGTLADCSRLLLLIYYTYLLSVAILLIFNKLLHLRASGHAASITGPVVFLNYFLGAEAFIPCLLLYILIFWASLEIKRHTRSEFVWGTISSLASLGIVLLCFGIQ